MAHIIDTRSADGAFVILGNWLTLPSSNAVGTPAQGSIRYNPTTSAIELYDPTTGHWTSFSGSAGTAQTYIPDSNTGSTGNIFAAESYGPVFADMGTDVSNSVVTATNTTYSRSLAHRFGEILNLKDYFAVGDGATDDSNAVNNWYSNVVSTGYPGVVPAGRYKITSQLVWDMLTRTNGITIVGEGVTTSVFDVSNVVSTPAVQIISSIGPTSNNKFSSIGFIGNLAGTVLQIGTNSYTDTMRNSQFDISVNNLSNSTSVTSVVVNSVRASTLRIVANSSGHGEAIHINAMSHSDLFGAFTNADTGIHFGNSISNGNTIRASVYGVSNCVSITSNSTNNTFLGGQYTWTQYGVVANAGNSNVFFNSSLNSNTNTFISNNSVGIIYTNGTLTQQNLVQGLGYTPIKSIGDTMTGNLAFSNNQGLVFTTNYYNTTGTKFYMSNANVLSLSVDNGAGVPVNVFSIPIGSNTSINFNVPILGNATSASKFVTPVTFNLTGDLSGSVAFDGSNSVVNLNTSLLPSSHTAVATYTQVSVDMSGRIVNGTLTGINNIYLSGDVIGNGIGNVVTTLNNTGVLPGTYAYVVVDSKGRVINGITALQTTNAAFTNITLSGTSNLIGFTDSKLNSNTGILFNSNILSIQTSNGSGGSRPVMTIAANSSNSVLNILSNVAMLGSLSVANGISGNASSATQWLYPMQFSLTGAVTGTTYFNGANAVTILTTNSPTGVVPGTYNQVVVSSNGLITSGIISTSFLQKTGDTLSGNLTVSNSAIINFSGLNNSSASFGLDNQNNFNLNVSGNRNIFSILSNSSNSNLNIRTGVSIIDTLGSSLSIINNDSLQHVVISATSTLTNTITNLPISYGITYKTQNKGRHRFYVNGAQQVIIVGSTNPSPNQMQLSGTAAVNTVVGNSVQITSVGNDSNIGIDLATKGSGNLTWNGNVVATQNYISTKIAIISANVSTLANLVSYPVGTTAYATDGRKPGEYDFTLAGRIPLANTTSSGVPVYYGYAAYANVVSNTPQWISSVDGYPVSN